MSASSCTVGQCPYPVNARGWCSTHYGRWQRHGDPLHTEKPSPRLGEAPLMDRLAHYVDAEGDCWEWKGTVGSQGYGQLWLGGKRFSAHRWVYEELVGPIGEGLTIDHLCRVRHCVNPDHLEAVTTEENIRRGYGTSGKHGRQKWCKRGHVLAGSNLYVRPGGKRECRTCRRLAR